MVTDSQFADRDAFARSIAAYIPVTLTRYILEDQLPQPGVPRSLQAATLFADISGFTAMSEELASDGPRGAEELNRVLLVTFTAMIDVIHDMGGAVSHFYGDAMSVYFPEDGQAARKALACAQMMQQLMLSSFGRAVTNRPLGKRGIFELTIKIGLGYGRCQELVVGSPNIGFEFVLTGQAIDEAAEAEKLARSGQVIASQAIMQAAGLTPTTPFQPLESPPITLPPTPILTWEAYPAEAHARLIETAVPFLPTALYERLRQTGSTDVAEHRPVTTLFVQFQLKGDQNDSSAIETAVMGKQLHAYYQWAMEIVRRFGQENARVNRVLTGDKGNQLHIMFGAPIAPDAPDQAIRCAIAMLREQPDIIVEQRIGLAVGKVFAGPVGSTFRREYTVVGDVVNLSARLMQAAAAGTVLTDPLTAARVGQSIEFEPLPPRQFKGKQGEISPYKVVRERQSATQLLSYLERWTNPLFDREEERALLDQMVAKALAAETQVVTLSGQTGSGKSRLLAYVAENWLSQGGNGYLGVCQQHMADIPYAPWRSIWRDLFGLTPSLSVAEQVALVQQKTAVLAPQLAEDAGLWAAPLGLPIPLTQELEELTAEARQARFFRLVRTCFETATATQPIMLILEGVQHADGASLALLDELVSKRKSLPLLIATTYRTGHTVSSTAVTQATHLVVEDLSGEHARQLLAHIVGTETLPLSVEQHLGLRDREGRDSPVNPLFLEEALNVMLAAKVLELNGTVKVHEERLSRMQVPDTIHGLLLARLDRLPPAERDLLQMASVIGRQFEIESLTAIARQPQQTAVLQMLKDLTEADMTRLVTADPEWVYLFQHAMTHEVAYESLPYARRQTLHAEVGGWIQNTYADNLRPYHPILAFHFSRAGVHDRALQYALLAAHEARTIFANREAIELYGLAETHLRSLEISNWWETAVDLYMARAETLLLMGEFGTAVRDVEACMALVQNQDGPLEKRIAAQNILAELRVRQGNFTEAKSLSNDIINRYGEQIGPDELAKAYQWSGVAGSSLGEFDFALEQFQKAETLCLEIKNNERLARVLENKAFVHYLKKQLEQSLDAMQRSIALSRRFSLPINVASSLSNVALIQFQLGKGAEALETLNESIALIEDKSKNFYALAVGNRAEVRTYLGQYQQAEVDFDTAVDLYQSMDDTQNLIELLLIRAYEYYLTIGKQAEAHQTLQTIHQLLEDNADNLPEKQVRYHLSLGRLRIAEQQYDQALTNLKQANSIASEQTLAWWMPAIYYHMAHLKGLMGHSDEVAGWCRQAIKAIGQEGCPDYLPLVQWTLAQVAETDQKKLTHLIACKQSLDKRARYYDRLVYYQRVGELLKLAEDEAVRKIGHDALERAAQLRETATPSDSTD